MIADGSWIYIILSRWAHVLCAGLLLGGTFFIAFLLKAGENPPADQSHYLQSRRGFKMTVHVSVLLLLVSGIYNSIRNWGAYRGNMPLTHALFGPHVLLALIALTILMVVFARKQSGSGERRWLRIATIVLFLTVLMASSLKYAREHPKAQPTARLPDAEINRKSQQTTSYSIG